ncbi:hypothetical protein JCM1841_006217 [Sporobolomyces salmonicolor]
MVTLSDSQPSSASSSLDMTGMASAFPLPPFHDRPTPAHASDLTRTSPLWPGLRGADPAAAIDDTSSGEQPYWTVFEFEEIDDGTPELSSSASSGSLRSFSSRTSPFSSPASSCFPLGTSKDSDPFLCGRNGDVGLGLCLVDAEREQALINVEVADDEGVEEDDDDFELPPFDPFGADSPAVLHTASFIKLETAPSPPARESLLRPIAVRPANFKSTPLPPVKAAHCAAASLACHSLLPSHFAASPVLPPPPPPASFPFAPRPSYVAPGPESSAPTRCPTLSLEEVSRIAALHNGRIPTSQQMAPPMPPPADGLPPLIVNTGNQGPMVVQVGDWRCGTCSFVNWRRRKICMRCFPFANDVGSAFAAQNQRAAYLAGAPMAQQQLHSQLHSQPHPYPHWHHPGSHDPHSHHPSLQLSLLSPAPPRSSSLRARPPFVKAHSFPNLPLAPMQAPDEAHMLESYFSAPDHRLGMNTPGWSRRPSSDKVRRRIGGVIGHPGLAF